MGSTANKEQPSDSDSFATAQMAVAVPCVSSRWNLITSDKARKARKCGARPNPDSVATPPNTVYNTLRAHELQFSHCCRCKFQMRTFQVQVSRHAASFAIAALEHSLWPDPWPSLPSLLSRQQTAIKIGHSEHPLTSFASWPSGAGPQTQTPGSSWDCGAPASPRKPPPQRQPE